MPELNSIKSSMIKNPLDDFFNDDSLQVRFPYHIGMERTPFCKSKVERNVVDILLLCAIQETC